MQRVIKFRVRNLITNKVVGYEALFPANIENTRYEWAATSNGTDWANEVFTGQDLQREQFTGLKDKNGTDIYQDDILNIDFGGYDDKNPWQVAWSMNDAAFIILGRHMGGDKRILPFQLGNGAEIIGNLYEEPEFLSV